MPLQRHDSYGRPLPRLAARDPQDVSASATNQEQRERILQLILGILDEHYPSLLRREVTAEVTISFTVRAGTIQDDMYVGIVRKYRESREGTGSGPLKGRDRCCWKNWGPIYRRKGWARWARRSFWVVFQ